MQPKTTAKDFFFYLAGFATLYVSAISLLSLLFAIVNKAFPDALNSAYYYGSYDPYSAGMRMAIASLIIVFPLYLVVASYLNRYLRANPEKKDIGVRKWLTYLTLFLTGIAVVTDLVVLVNTFLGGEITTRFILKVLAVLVVSGAVFWYYLYDLKKSFTPDMPNRAKLIVALASVFVLASLITGFVLLGSPMKARAQKFDERRISDLSSIQWQVINYWQQKGQVPASLSDLKDPISGYVVPVDPETGEEYGYEKSPQNLSFKICAEFSLPTDERSRVPATTYPMRVGENENWKHGKGRQCFDRAIDQDLYPVRDRVKGF
jgi:hypothetical protein